MINPIDEAIDEFETECRKDGMGTGYAGDRHDARIAVLTAIRAEVTKAVRDELTTDWGWNIDDAKAAANGVAGRLPGGGEGRTEG